MKAIRHFREHFPICWLGLVWCRTQILTHSVACFCRFTALIHFFSSASQSSGLLLGYTDVILTCTEFILILIVRSLGKHNLHSKDYPISVDRQYHDGYTEIYRYDRRNYSLYRSLNSQCKFTYLTVFCVLSLNNICKLWLISNLISLPENSF